MHVHLSKHTDTSHLDQHSIQLRHGNIIFLLTKTNDRNPDRLKIFAQATGVNRVRKVGHRDMRVHTNIVRPNKKHTRAVTLMPPEFTMNQELSVAYVTKPLTIYGMIQF